jgi:wyosine [tRNA(Phe)-imidazoG37] synthetase (radical SAM superfamily)
MYAYGPVPSRRFGRSVGVSPIPEKTCSYSCIYCQLGRTRTLTAERQNFFRKEDIFADIEKVVRANEGNIDYITFVGDGEPTLNRDIGDLIGMCKTKFPYKTAVITNGSLLWKEDVRRDLLDADVVNITMSAGDHNTFKNLHRPHITLNFEKVWQGIHRFATEFKGKIWAEIMLVDRVNDDTAGMCVLKECIDTIKPVRSYVMVPTRPPAEPWVHIPSAEKILEALTIFSGENITQKEEGGFGLDEFKNATEAIYEICRRHPLRLSQAQSIEAYFAQRILDRLIAKGEFNVVTYQKHKFLLPSEFVFGPKEKPSFPVS